MTLKVPIFWHHALSPIHRKVAIASFLQAVRHRGAVLYYPPGDAAIAAIREAAAAVGVPAYAIDRSDLATHARAETWVWIGSHDAPDDSACRALTAGEPPPVAILCLNSDAEGFQPPALPTSHQPFVTGHVQPYGIAGPPG